MLKLLFIEDDPNTIQNVVNLLSKELSISSDVSSFEDAETKISSDRPDIVILDLLGGVSAAEPEPEGLKTREFIWDHHFCPLVIYSARPDIYEERYEKHPLVRPIKKGSGSPELVLAAVRDLCQHVESLKEAEDHIRQSFSDAMRDVAPYVFEAFNDVTLRNEILKRSGRRRLAALMDGLTRDATTLASWEQYLFPPISNDLMLGDVLMKADGTPDNPTTFRLVLTPSCDLDTSNGRSPKVSNVLVACCTSIEDALNRMQMRPRRSGLDDEKKITDFKENFRKSVLTQGYFQSLLPLPCLRNKIPSMAANLRNLELIPIPDIGDSGKPFWRIASIDSPFRELVAWAYLNTACRPGLPDRDFNSWCDEIIGCLEMKLAKNENESH